MGVQRKWDDSSLGQISCLTPFISCGGKNQLSVIAALDDVLRLAGDHVTGKARHGRSPEMG